MTARRGGNALLDALPHDLRDRLLAKMTRVPLGVNESVWEPDQTIKRVYFPLSGLISLVIVTSNGTGVELAAVGNEGMVGVPVFLGAVSTPNLRAISLLPGDAMFLSARVFRDEAEPGGALHEVMRAYTNAWLTEAAQEVACNRLHTTLQRCSRWLLLAHDATGIDDFPLTQESLSRLLGVRRASVGVCAAKLQETGFIRCRRGRVRVIDRKGLEDASCECYGVVRDAFASAARRPR